MINHDKSAKPRDFLWVLQLMWSFFASSMGRADSSRFAASRPGGYSKWVLPSKKAIEGLDPLGEALFTDQDWLQILRKIPCGKHTKSYGIDGP